MGQIVKASKQGKKQVEDDLSAPVKKGYPATKKAKPKRTKYWAQDATDIPAGAHWAIISGVRHADNFGYQVFLNESDWRAEIEIRFKTGEDPKTWRALVVNVPTIECKFEVTIK